MPDGVTPAPQGTQVRISFGDLTVTTRADGTFQSLLPIPGRQLHRHRADGDRRPAAGRWTRSCRRAGA